MSHHRTEGRHLPTCPETQHYDAVEGQYLPYVTDQENVVTGPRSAYDIAVLHGFNGTEEEWQDSLNVGNDGLYGEAKALGFTGNYSEFQHSLYRFKEAIDVTEEKPPRVPWSSGQRRRALERHSE